MPKVEKMATEKEMQLNIDIKKKQQTSFVS
jgi:hypothetical protein